MLNVVEIVVWPEELDLPNVIESKISQALEVNAQTWVDYRIIRKSIDARKKPVYRLKIEVSFEQKFPSRSKLNFSYKNVDSSKKIIIVGAGPAGYFAALECLELGLKPIVLDRGKEVRERRRDLKAIQQEGIVNPNSNYCFGEGGAGTYSDGKLYTRATKRGDINKVLSILVDHGADEEILIEAHPHIGSNRLPSIIENIRATIERFGGEVHFNAKVIDLLIHQNKILGVITEGNKEWLGTGVILATGHSARDIFYMLQTKNLALESKSFALGVRIEHPQLLIDELQYQGAKRSDHLPAASYALTCEINKRGVFSFCMCPGGLMVPSSTSPGEIVINGMSLSRRDSLFANSGTVVALHPGDFESPENPFSGLLFQKSVEQKLFLAGNGSQAAPAQRLTDFVNGKISASLPASSYIPGLWSAPLNDLLPAFIFQALREGIKVFDRKMKGYFTDQAVVVATESRTSSPIRIPRNSLSMHPQCDGLFPCGEGAGYAGGIVSAAMDGQFCARNAYHYCLN